MGRVERGRCLDSAVTFAAWRRSAWACEVLAERGWNARYELRRSAIRMTPTSEGLLVGTTSLGGREATGRRLGQSIVSGGVLFDPPWHPARISPDGKVKLGLQ